MLPRDRATLGSVHRRIDATVKLFRIVSSAKVRVAKRAAAPEVRAAQLAWRRNPPRSDAFSFAAPEWTLWLICGSRDPSTSAADRSPREQAQRAVTVRRSASEKVCFQVLSLRQRQLLEH